MFIIPIGRESSSYLSMLSATALILYFIFPPLAIIPFIILFLFRNSDRTVVLSTLCPFAEVILYKIIHTEVNKGYNSSGGIMARGVVK